MSDNPFEPSKDVDRLFVSTVSFSWFIIISKNKRLQQTQTSIKIKLVHGFIQLHRICMDNYYRLKNHQISHHIYREIDETVSSSPFSQEYLSSCVAFKWMKLCLQHSLLGHKGALFNFTWQHISFLSYPESICASSLTSTYPKFSHSNCSIGKFKFALYPVMLQCKK